MELLNYQQTPVYPLEIDTVRKPFDHDEAFYQQLNHHQQLPPAIPAHYPPQPHHHPHQQQPGTGNWNYPPPGYSQDQIQTQQAPPAGDDYNYQDAYALHPPPQGHHPQSQQASPGYAHLAPPGLALLLVLGSSQPAPAPAPASGQFDIGQYPDMTTLVNSNHNIVVPLVELTFVDHKVCLVCGKRITRDMSRHMRTHQAELRFSCKFPKSQCRHKLGKFNRPYDFKKHLLNRHFKFDNLQIKRLHNLSDKLNHWGTCPCGERYMGKEWLSKHILTEDALKRCRFIEQ